MAKRLSDKVKNLEDSQPNFNVPRVNESCEHSLKPHYSYCDLLGSPADYEHCIDCKFYSPRGQK